MSDEAPKQRRKIRVPLSTEDDRAPSKDLWMIPYADLMSNMMILFLALFAYSYDHRSPEFDKAMQVIGAEMSADAGKGVVVRQRLKEATIAVDIKKQLEGMAIRDFGVRVTSRYIHITLPSPVLFRSGSVRLSPDARRILSTLSRSMVQTNNPILVAGHTDDRPIVGGHYRTNWELSAARAYSVIDYLVQGGLPAERFMIRGHGEFRPVASNDTLLGREKNRRIEIRLVREVVKEG